MSVAEDIKELKGLYDDGLITEEEYRTQKQRVLDNLGNGNPANAAGDASKMVEEEKPEYLRSRIAAGVLAIVLGGLGIHKFYLGYKKEGALMLACALGLPVIGWALAFVIGFCGGMTRVYGISILAIIPTILGFAPFIVWGFALVEGIIYLTMSDERFNDTHVEHYKGWM